MDPVESLRADIPVLHPLQRVAYLAEVAEANEERQRQDRMAERRAQAEAVAMERQARQRMELLTRGHTTEELAQYSAEVAERKAARIAELEAELDRIDPRRRAAQAQRAQQVPQQVREAVTLMRARKPDEFMRREVARAEARAEVQRSAWLKDEIALETVRAQAEAAGEISRSQPGRVNGTAVPAAEERFGVGDDVYRDADGRQLTCVFVPDGRGGHKHVKHGGRCLLRGGGDVSRTVAGTGWPQPEMVRETATSFAVS